MKNKITIIGLGPGGKDLLSVKAYELILTKDVILRTSIHPCVEEFEDIEFDSFDYLYDESEDFRTVYETIAEILIEDSKEEHIYYAVTGNPLFHEKSVQLILEKAPEEGIEVEIVPGISYIDTIADDLEVDFGEEGLLLIDSYDLIDDKITANPNVGVLIGEVFNSFVLSEVKLSLMKYYRDDTEVILISHSGRKEKKLIKTPLYELDHYEADHLTSIFIPKQEDLVRTFDDLYMITKVLRSPEGCPWDREQTHESLKRYLIEETYEVIDALDKEDMENLQEELGDLLFEILIHSVIAEEKGDFNIFDVLEGISEKMIRRHPHVFGNLSVSSSEDVLPLWDEVKAKEKKKMSFTEEMENIPKGTPELIISDKIQRKAKKIGFDWDDPLPALDKVSEEVGEVREAIEDKSSIEHLREEIGDLLFACVNVARLCDIEPDEALRLANKKFINRLKKMDVKAQKEGKNLSELSLDQLEELWESVKAKN